MLACEPVRSGPGTWVAGIVNGTRTPQVVPLSPEEILAIGWLFPTGSPGNNFCTGTLIGPRVVATADHCVAGSSANEISFGIGQDPAAPVATFDSAAIWEHPSVDAALLVLTESATLAANAPRPILANRDPLPASAIGRAVDAAGYGDTRSSRDGRWFARVFLAEINPDTIVVDGRGQQGICYGDSGGPVVDVGTSSTPVVLAVESFGDSSCVDQDTMTRLDAVADWIDPILAGETPVDPCNGLDYLGRCSGNVVEWCDRGQILQRDCTPLGTSCGWANNDVGYACTCGDLDYLGRCDGPVAEYCENGSYTRVNCGARGRACGWVDATTGYFCTSNPTCTPEDAVGRCTEDTLIRCENGVTTRRFCDQQGLVCRATPAGADCFDPGNVPDAGSTPPDAGSAPDASAGDAGDVQSDAGSNPGDASPGVPEPKDEGCGCQTTRASGSPFWLLLLLSGVIVRRTRRRA